jgi:surface protein
MDSLNLSGVYLGTNSIDKIYLGDNIVYTSSPPPPTPTLTPTPEASATPTPTITPSTTLTATLTPTSSASSTPTITPTSTSTPTVTTTITSTPTPTPTPTQTIGSDSSLLTLVYNTNLQSQNTIVNIPIRNTNGSIGTIYWGDNTSTTYNQFTNQFVSHTYANHGEYTVTISGTLKTFDYSVSSFTLQSKPKLSGCLSFGNVSLTNLSNGFANCRNLSAIPSYPPNNTTNIDYLFYDTILNDSKMVNYFQPSTMTTLRGVFAFNPNFNQDITNWNVSGVTSTKELFRSCTSFNQNISSWDISSNTDMDSMFAGATSFNQNINSWDVSQVTTFSNAFDGATSFNQNISNWDISSISSSTGLNNFMRSVTLSSSNYGSLLESWNANKNSYRNDLSPNFGSSKYCSNTSANAARSGLVSYGWIITDGGSVIC